MGVFGGHVSLLWQTLGAVVGPNMTQMWIHLSERSSGMRAGIMRWAAGAALGCVLTVAGTALGQTDGSGTAPQDSVTDQVRQLRDLVYKQQEQINQLQGQQSQTGSGGSTMNDDQRKEILALIKEEMKDQAMPDWVTSLKVTGDFRLRSEWIEKANTEANQLNGVTAGKPAPLAQTREESRQ